MDEIYEIIRQYWLNSPDNYPNVFTMSKTFGVTPEKICDILLVDFEKAEFSNKIIYFKNNSFKTFQTPITFSLNYKNKLSVYCDNKPYSFSIETNGEDRIIEEKSLQQRIDDGEFPF